MANELNNIDLVYLWVDGEDPQWRSKYNAFTGKTEEKSEKTCKGRYVNNDELKYSLRAVEMYAPWIHKIYIVTDNQTPQWLDTSNPKIKVVDHKEIMPSQSLPCFNSALIEQFLYKIPGLSEKFIYANDDMFINKELTINDLFTPEGFPIIRMTRKPFRKFRWFWREKICRKPLKNYSKKIARAAQIIEKKYGIYYSGMPHHNIDAYLKSDFKRVTEEIMRKDFEPNLQNRTRNDNDIQRVIFSYIALAEKRGLLRYVDNKESMHLHIHKKRHYEKLDKYQPLFFCMNDSEYADDNDRIMAKNYLDKRFPQKSSVEK